MKWLAPAKINLSLRVLRKRDDGFHEIESLMVPLSLADELTVTLEESVPAGGPTLTCDDPTLPTDARNLAYRAAELFREHLDQALPAVRIHLAKRIPHGAGLGGGSSDAATVLLALNELCSGPFTRAQLAQMAAQLGSDVPFFIYQCAAICRGRGEDVALVSFGTTLRVLLIKPVFSVPTPWAYKRWLDSRELPGGFYQTQRFEWGELVNDLERPVFEKYLVLSDLKNWLLTQPEVAGALMSGSGSTMIAVLRGTGGCDDLLARVQARFGETWTCVCTTATSQPPGTSVAVAKPETTV